MDVVQIFKLLWNTYVAYIALVGKTDFVSCEVEIRLKMICFIFLPLYIHIKVT